MSSCPPDVKLLPQAMVPLPCKKKLACTYSLAAVVVGVGPVSGFPEVPVAFAVLSKVLLPKPTTCTALKAKIAEPTFNATTIVPEPLVAK